MAELDWGPQDSAATREFLASQTGVKLLAKLHNSMKPKAGNTFEENALNYRELLGRIDILELINEAASEEPEQVSGDMGFVNTSEGSTFGK